MSKECVCHMMEDGVLFCLDQAVSVRKEDGTLDFVRIAAIDPFLERARVVSPDMDKEVDMATLSPLELARDNLTWYVKHPTFKLNIDKTYKIPVDYVEFHKAGGAAIKGEKELAEYMKQHDKDIIAFYNGKLKEYEEDEEADRKAEEVSILSLKFSKVVRDMAGMCDAVEDNNFIASQLRTILNEVFNANASIIRAAKANIKVVEHYMPEEEKK
jgi:hypothetical protein